MISIIDYKAGNLTSVERALKKLSIPCRITQDPDLILQSDRVIFPGVGAAGEAMKVLQASRKVLQIPHMGWDLVQWNRMHPLINPLPPQSNFYFVHSYYPVPRGENLIL